MLSAGGLPTAISRSSNNKKAIVINKILLRDDTCCIKPDLQVHLVAGAVQSIKKQKGETAYSALRRIFRQRLVDFLRDHPEEWKSCISHT
jgi:chromatin licensing and DNA replication factor 1